MKHYCKNGDEIKVGGVYVTKNGQDPIIAVTSIDSVNMFPIKIPSRKGKGRQNGMAASTVTNELPRDSDGYYLWEGGECPVPGEWVINARDVTDDTTWTMWRADELDWSMVTSFRVVSTGEEVKQKTYPIDKPVPARRSHNSPEWLALNWETVPEVPYTGEGLEFGACLNADTDQQKMKRVFDDMKKERKAEYNGGAVSYYTVHVSSPKTIAGPYDAECSDIIESLNMNFAEGEAFKALWRKAAARLGKRKEGYDNGLYDAEKVAMFGSRLVVLAKAESKCNYPDCNCPFDMGADNKCLRGLNTDHLRKGVR